MVTKVKGSVDGSVLDNIEALLSASQSGQYTTLGYHTAGDGGHGLYIWDSTKSKASHNGGSVIDPTVTFPTLGNETSIQAWFTAANAGSGCWVLLDTVTDAIFGVISAASYDYDNAFFNRYAYDIALGDTSVSYIEFVPASGFKAIWGSINCARGDLYINHRSGCDIRGYYSDPAQVANGQAGHMFGFVAYDDPYPGTDYTLSGTTLSNIFYRLDGKVSTIYRASHTSTHNNNVIAFYDTENCSVVGQGGVTASDHNGIAFDGLCLNPSVDVAYIDAYSNRAVTMKGTSGTADSAFIKIGSLGSPTKDGGTGESILCRDFTYVDIKIGAALLPASPSNDLLSLQSCERVNLAAGYVENARFIASMTDSGSLYIDGLNFKDVLYLVRRGGTSPASFAQRVVSIKNAIAETSSTNLILYLDQYATSSADGLWQEYRVGDCDFSRLSGTVNPYSGYSTNDSPSLINFYNNIVPSGWVYNSKVWNKVLTRPNTAVGGSSFVYDTAGTNGDSPYKTITIIMTHSSDSSRYPLEINLEDLYLTSAQYLKATLASDGSRLQIIATRSGTSVTFTFSASAGTGSISSYSLSN